MSTYWYLECLDHDPPLMSDDEVEQHTYGLPAIRELVAKREFIAALPDFEATGYFERNTVRFLRQHVKCSLQFKSEYGTVEVVLSTASEGRTTHDERRTTGRVGACGS